VSLKEARGFVGEHHRHNMPPRGWKFGVGLVNGTGELRGVAVAGNPVARMLNDGKTVEITRVATLGDKNANSMLYGAILRAAKALGYDRAVTYTLQSESGASLKASGWTPDGEVAVESWNRKDRPRQDEDLFGNRRIPDEPKVRWVRVLL